jgi:hypothetical protein
MQYYNVLIKHTFDTQPDHLVGQQAYIPHEAHLMITKVTSKTIEGVAVLIDVPKPFSLEETHVLMKRVPYIPGSAKTGNIFTDSPAKVISSMVNIIGQHQTIWTRLEIKKLKTDDLMRTILETGRLYPDVLNQQEDCRQHLYAMFKNKQVITTKMQNDAISKEEAQQAVQLPDKLTLGKIVVIAAHFPTVTNVIAQEILLRYNQTTKKAITDLNAEVISDRDPLWALKKFFEKANHPEEDGQGWIIELDFKPDDAFSMKVFNEILLPKLVLIAKKTLVIITTDSIQVAQNIEHKEIQVIKG